MQLNRYTFSAVVFIIFCQIVVPAQAQLGVSFDIKKPQEYEDRVLGSEKSEQKKFTLPRRFIQNSFTHYNYFFNANNKLNEIIERAKTLHRDDYSTLLSFYNYSLDITAQDKAELDSVIYKSTTGIVLHDLRNDWIDNMYLLMGAAYYLRKEFDSAYLTFQFINYAFAEKEKDGYYRNIGSNLDGNNAFSIATKEKNSLPRKAFSEPPSRNDAFIWQIRSLIAQEEYAEAASLIVTLKNDPLFPKRLQNDLEEVQAWWFYNNNMFDSAALHLSNALSAAPTKKEKARWEFLTAQLYEIAGNTEMAKMFYEKAINHTVDPVMEIYARLHSIRINKEGGENFIDRNIAELLKMAKRDKYFDYKDVIYYTLAQMELQRNNFDAAQVYLGKSASFNSGNIELFNKAWLQMAEIAYAGKKYRMALSYYDSLRLNDPSLKNIEKINERKLMLGKIVSQIEIIERQDSLQRIAGMGEEERKEYVRKLVKDLRKQQGLKDEAVGGSSVTNSSSQGNTDLFTSPGKGEWYFYNTTLRTKGVSEFKARWGNRPNVDNWRRISAASQAAQKQALAGKNPAGLQNNQPGEITFDALYGNLPLDEKRLALSNDSIQKAMHLLGKAFAEDVEDCNASVSTLEDLRSRFPRYEKMDDVLFTLYYCYQKTGETAKADQIKKLMNESFGTSPLTAIVSTGKDPRNKNSNTEATKTYENIYDLFIEGRFSEAIEEKKKADSIYGSHYWTPQLLYIEAVYYIRQRQDSIALRSLVQITQQHSGTPLSSKASNLINVLGRRQQIEEELTNLQVERPVEKPAVKTDTATVVQAPRPNITQPPVVNNQDVQKTKTDTASAKPVFGPFSFNAVDRYFVAMFLNKTDPVWANEAKNAFFRYNREKYYNKVFEISLAEISPDYRVMLIGNFDNAQAATEYVQAAKPRAPLEIIPWLKGDKYSFSIITSSNLDILKAQKDVNAYKQFLETHLPGKF